MADLARDNPGVIIFPPLLLLIVIVAGLLLEWLVPLGVLANIPAIPRMIAGLVVFALGVAIASAGRTTFIRAGTNVRPDQPALSLVSTGIFAHLRNPMYVGGSIAVLGLALILASDWVALLMVPALVVLHYGVVKREELYLEHKFGEAYRQYKATVPRYGW
jgi:protein-S-isoprenylcysteine O-methyltransferase Ste14